MGIPHVLTGLVQSQVLQDCKTGIMGISPLVITTMNWANRTINWLFTGTRQIHCGLSGNNHNPASESKAI